MGLHFQLISATGVKYDDDAYEVVVPTKDGTIAIFADHMPILAAGAPGILRIRKRAADSDAQMVDFAIYGGVLQAEGQAARFVSDDVTTAEDVSEQAASEALERAKKLVSSATNRQELHEARTVMHHHEVRLNLARLKKRHHH